jgi:hypothetical protein
MKALNRSFLRRRRFASIGQREFLKRFCSTRNDITGSAGTLPAKHDRLTLDSVVTAVEKAPSSARRELLDLTTRHQIYLAGLVRRHAVAPCKISLTSFLPARCRRSQLRIPKQCTLSTADSLTTGFMPTRRRRSQLRIPKQRTLSTVDNLTTSFLPTGRRRSQLGIPIWRDLTTNEDL